MTAVVSGPTRNVHLEATQHHVGLCVHRIELKNNYHFLEKKICRLVIVLTPTYAEYNSFTFFGNFYRLYCNLFNVYVSFC